MATYNRQSKSSVEENKYQEKPRYSPDDELDEESTTTKGYERIERRRFTFDEAKSMFAGKRDVGRTHERDR